MDPFSLLPLHSAECLPLEGTLPRDGPIPTSHNSKNNFLHGGLHAVPLDPSGMATSTDTLYMFNEDLTLALMMLSGEISSMFDSKISTS